MNQQIFQTMTLFLVAILLTVGYGIAERMHYWSYTTPIDSIVENWNDRQLSAEEIKVRTISVEQVLTNLRSEFASSDDDSVKRMLGACIRNHRLPYGSWIVPTTSVTPTGTAKFDFQSPLLHFSRVTVSPHQPSAIALNLLLDTRNETGQESNIEIGS